MRHITLLLTISLFIISCGQTDTKQKELELKERELAIKEKELEIDSIKHSVSAEANSKTSSIADSKPSITVNTTTESEKNTDRSRFIGTYQWSGNCPRGCDYTYVFSDNGKVIVTFESGQGTESATNDWSINEKTKTLKLGVERFTYKFKGKKIVLIDTNYPDDLKELTPHK